MNRPVSPHRRALLSVSDKTGLVSLATGLLDLAFELVSTGGTALDMTDVVGCLVIGAIKEQAGDNGPRFFVTDLRPAPEGAEDDIPF